LRVAVVLEHRFDRTPDGTVWTRTQFPRPFWQRYLDVFDEVRVVARVREVPEAASGWARADGDGVVFAPVAHYIGPREYVRRAAEVRRSVRAAVPQDGAVIMRVGSHLAAQIEPLLARRGQPYGLEVVYDPFDMFARGSMEHPARAFFRWLFPRQLREQCRRATAVAYVTEHALQRRYPPGPGAFTTHYSSVELPQDVVVPTPRTVRVSGRRAQLVTVGAYDHLYKGPDVLLDAVGACVRDGMDLALTLVGDGKLRPDLERRARGLGLEDRVRFRGELTRASDVRSELDAADLFVLPSRQEGLPRAVVEAMARGLPCVASTVGGIPELLPAEDLVPPGSADALAAKLREVLSDPERLTAMSARNLERAHAYREDVLRGRRQAFYGHLRDRTAAWLASSGTAATGRG
jgi:glycosyltransferase involved in cell wall biosynthesis